MTDNGSIQRLIYIGMLSWHKGPQFLLEALGQIIVEFPYLYLMMVGDGPQCTDLKNQAHRLQVADRVDFIGQVPVTLMEKYYERVDVCVIPSLFETFSMVACEAMAHGLPVIAARRGSLPELVVDGVTGLLVEPTDPQAIATAVRRLVRNPGEARQMGINGQDRTRRLYSPDSYLNHLKDVVYFVQT